MNRKREVYVDRGCSCSRWLSFGKAVLPVYPFLQTTLIKSLNSLRSGSRREKGICIEAVDIVVCESYGKINSDTSLCV